MKTSKSILFIMALIGMQLVSPLAGQAALARDFSRDGFCARIEKGVDQSLNKLNKSRSMTKRQAMKLMDKDETLGKMRDDFDKKRTAYVNGLLKIHTSPDQKEAIIQYQASIQSATVLRRTKIDSIRAEFRSKLGDISIYHRQQVDEFENGFVTNIRSAFENAMQACQSGKDDSLVREDFSADVKRAKSEFSQSKVGLKNDGEMQSLITDRDQRLQLAYDEFKNTIEQARQKLIATLKPN